MLRNLARATGLAASIFALSVCAQAAAKTHAAHSDPVDFSGVWYPYQPEGFDFLPLPELTSAADKIFKTQRAEEASGITRNDSTGRCIPPGMPRLLNRVYPMQIVRTPKDIISLHEYESQMRFIHMDGRKHPQGDDLTPTFNGDSIGHWEGSALVIDSVGFRTEVAGWPTQPMNGIRITAQFHLIERWTLSKDGNLLTDAMTITDPTVFAKTWKTQKRFKRRDDWELMEFTCLPEENPIAINADGVDFIKNIKSPAASKSVDSNK